MSLTIPLVGALAFGLGVMWAIAIVTVTAFGFIEQRYGTFGFVSKEGR